MENSLVHGMKNSLVRGMETRSELRTDCSPTAAPTAIKYGRHPLMLIQTDGRSADAINLERVRRQRRSATPASATSEEHGRLSTPDGRAGRPPETINPHRTRAQTTQSRPGYRLYRLARRIQEVGLLLR